MAYVSDDTFRILYGKEYEESFEKDKRNLCLSTSIVFICLGGYMYLFSCMI